ncbi:ABC transporter ATP-binding protein [Cellulomonas sp. P24]|uniref:ABC transporter ATP-binding protein n=1 Tax=Cellulomonas sp. P24 TaxID=2885206 RepID=UPI00216B622B|nr:ABC transporter ATP-binding protein [Cellulomonas sp. P24]MCR6494465.1 ABC transporter ATP-binding protein [Cellulomonas sp. P24]
MTDAAIHTQGLSKSYGDKPALRHLDLTVATGEIFGLLGHNGAGKTTTVNLLTTLLEPTGGALRIGGLDGARDPNGVRRLIGYLPENVQFYDNLTTVENLRYFARLSGLRRPDGRIREVLEYLDFTGHDHERVGTFSKGMRQRVGIAQAIVHSPQILFLDEPTSGLDPQGVRNLREIIVGLNRDLGMTIFMNTHLLAEVTRTCTSIGILSAGELAYHASMEETTRAFPGEESLEDIYLQIESQRAA